MNTSELLKTLSVTDGISGSEAKSANFLTGLLAPLFTSYSRTSVGSHVFTRSCGKQNAKKVLLDAHYDQIGLMVREITPEGFLRVMKVGGLDARVFPSLRVNIYGKKTIPGIVVSTPPHLQKKDDADKLPDISDLLIDTGYSAEKLREIVRIGTFVGYATPYTELANHQVAGMYFDNRACAVAAIRTAELLSEMKDLPFDIVLLLSSFEETGGIGAETAAYEICPDVAFCLDVDFGRDAGVPSNCAIDVGGGPSITKSMVLTRRLYESMISFASANKLKYQTVVSAKNTGTNAEDIEYTRQGVPTAGIGLPLKNMHTPNEIVSLDDIDDTARLLSEYIAKELPKWMNN